MKSVDSFCFLFRIGISIDFHKTNNIGIRCVIGPENILFAGVCVCFLARKCYGLGREEVKRIGCYVLRLKPTGNYYRFYSESKIESRFHVLFNGHERTVSIKLVPQSEHRFPAVS